MKPSKIKLVMIPPSSVTEGLTTQSEIDSAVAKWAFDFNEFMKEVPQHKKGILTTEYEIEY